MLTPERRSEFEARGVVRLARAVDPGKAESLGRSIREYLVQRGALRAAPRPGSMVTASHSGPFTKQLAFQGVWGARIVTVIDEILGTGAWLAPRDAGQFLGVVEPVRAEWSLPHKMWHLDYPAPASLRVLPGLQLFLCLDRIEARGGGTLGVAGSHRLVDALRARRGAGWEGRSAKVRESLAREVPWIGALFSARAGEDRIARFMEKETVDGGAPLQVVEFTGEPGDAIVMHPWLIHAPSPSCGSRPRMALTLRVRTPAW